MLQLEGIQTPSSGWMSVLAPFWDARIKAELHFKGGYWQVETDEPDCDKTTLTSHF